LSFIFFFPCWILFIKAEVLKRLFIGIRRREEAVRLRAERAFFEKRALQDKEEYRGSLLSLPPREKSLVLADKGIYER